MPFFGSGGGGGDYHVKTNNNIVGGNLTLVNNTGTNDIALGNNALSANTTGSDNIAIGLNAAYGWNIGGGAFENGVGARNVCVGTNAGYQVGASITPDTNNVLIGYNNSSTFLGGNTGRVSIGSNAGGSNTLSSGGDGDILIGYNNSTNYVGGGNNIDLGSNGRIGYTVKSSTIGIGNSNSNNNAAVTMGSILIGFEWSGGFLASLVGPIVIGNVTPQLFADNSITIGHSTINSGTNSIIIGSSINNASNNVIKIGNTQANVIIGNYNLATISGGGIGNSSTFAALPGAGTVSSGTIYRVTDVGVNGSFWYSDGANWLPVSNSITILNQESPCGIAPTGTIAANGALTLGTALPTTYSQGIWLYFPAGAVYAGSLAGIYWVLMTTTFLGTVYNNIATVPGTLLPPSPLTPIVAAGPGAYIGVNGITINLVGATIPANVLKKGNIIRHKSICTNNGSANNKLYRADYGSACNMLFNVQSTNTVSYSGMLYTKIINTNIQVNDVNTGLNGAGAFVGTVLRGSSNISNSQTVMFALNLSGIGADYGIYEGSTIEIL